MKGFYSKVHTTEWPILQELQVIGCNKVETFARDQNLSFLGRQGESQLDFSVQQPLFWVHEVGHYCSPFVFEEQLAVR
ncbi:hypothetical protein CCACVL1_22867 [Corchorus capsularis]|uniref:Uncharacterized protein n=1 Tax=Corchorus capsularis TaxID=210143 RepID=A0A1R3GWD2_COCAP|nr:hypothetical protein CCACVL1_22867 [Corchorus capsularis]